MSFLYISGVFEGKKRELFVDIPFFWHFESVSSFFLKKGEHSGSPGIPPEGVCSLFLY